MKRILSLLLLLLLPFALMSHTLKTFELKDLMGAGRLSSERLFTEWWGDILVETDLDTVAARTDAHGRVLATPEILFTLDEVNAAIASSDEHLNSLYYCAFPDEVRPVVLFTARRTRFLYDWEQHRVVWRQNLIEGAEDSDFCYPTRSEAYVKGDNLWVLTAEGDTMQVSTDGSRDIVYGQSVHRDEFGINKGTYWSPQGSLLAFYRMDQSEVTDFPLIDIDHRVAQPAPEKYPMAGMTSHSVKVGVFNLSARSTIYLDTDNPTDRYFTNISWAPDEQTLYMIELPRSQDTAQLVAYDAHTGEKLRVLLTETHEKYVHPMHPIVFLPWDATKFIYQSENEGYNHLYLFDLAAPKGKQMKRLIEGAWVVEELLGFDEENRSVIIASNETGWLRRNTWAVRLKDGRRTLLDNGEGQHHATLSKGGRFLVDTWSAPEVYRCTDLLSASKNAPSRLLTAADPWDGYAKPEISSGSILADDDSTELFYRMVMPVGFDPVKKYPAVVYVYNGPSFRNVDESWHYGYRPWEIYMAQRGYVIFCLDGRGSSLRGLGFENCTYRHLGDIEMLDQLRGVDFLRSLPYIDTERLGVHGWSYGGYMTVNLMCSYPDVFKVGVAGGPVIDWRFYEVMYGERYMSTPQENPEGYASSSLLPKAKNLTGRLQIIVGLNDPVCVLQHSLSFLRACEDAGTQPDYFVYPSQGHNMAGQDALHLHERITRYFDDFLR